MALVRWITEMGLGVDVHGGDYTKAAERAVSDALRHSSLNFFAAAGKTRHDMHIEVVIGVTQPDAIDRGRIAAQVPYGTVIVTAITGGLDVAAPQGDDVLIMANAAPVIARRSRAWCGSGAQFRGEGRGVLA
jgi:uncharacterized protein (TIGR02058 family)